MRRLVLIALLAILATPIKAETWPSRPLTMVVPFATGGPMDAVATNWSALFLPKDTPAFIVQRLHDATVAAMNNPTVQRRFKENGIDPVADERRSSAYLAQFVASEIAKWAGPIKASGLALE